MEKFRHIDTWVFDLDNTLYDAETEVFTRMGERMTAYVARFLNLSPDAANSLRKEYWQKYGTTLRGLMIEHKIDPLHFLNDVHDLDLSNVPQCKITQGGLARLSGRKVIFTNSDRKFAEKMARHLGILDQFEDIFSIENAGFIPKPAPEAFHAAINHFKFNPKTACMFEDMAENLKTAADFGMTTVWLHGKNEKPAAEDTHIHHAHEKLTDWFRTHLKG